MSIYLHMHGAPWTAALACEKHAPPSGQDGTQKQPLSLSLYKYAIYYIYTVWQSIYVYMVHLGRQLWLARNLPHHPARMGPRSSLSLCANILYAYNV